MNLRYEAIDERGMKSGGVVSAANPDALRKQLLRKGLHVVEVRETDEAVASGGKSKSKRGVGRGLTFGGGKQRLANMVGFSRQMALLVSTGTPLMQALTAVEEQTKDPGFRAVLGRLKSRVEAGVSLSEAMSDERRAFDAVARSLVQAGESSGKLSAMLDRLSLLARQQQSLSKQVSGAMAYPVMLMSVSVVVIITTLLTVVPRFAGMFDSLGADLPESTAMLLYISGALQKYWWAMLLGIGGVVGGVFAYLKTPAGRHMFHAAALRAPLVGGLIRDLAIARVCRLLGVLLSSRVPLLEALELVREASTMEPVRRLIEKAIASITDGNTLSEVLEESPLVSSSISAASRSGEESGRLGEVMTSLADHLDEDNAVIVKTLSSVLEPAILGVLGVVVGSVTLSLFLPLFDLTSAAGGH